MSNLTKTAILEKRFDVEDIIRGHQFLPKGPDWHSCCSCGEIMYMAEYYRHLTEKILEKITEVKS